MSNRIEFDKWAARHDFWKPDTHAPFLSLWCELEAADMSQSSIEQFLDDVVSAMKAEYAA